MVGLQAIIVALLVAWSAPIRDASPDRAASTPVAVYLAGDFDGDGAVDLLISSATGLRVSLSGQARAQLLTRTCLASVLAADADRDGDVDVVALTRSGSLLFWRNDGHGRFREAEPRSSSAPRALSDPSLGILNPFPQSAFLGGPDGSSGVFGRDVLAAVLVRAGPAVDPATSLVTQLRFRQLPPRSPPSRLTIVSVPQSL